MAALGAARVSPGDTVLLPDLICRDVLASLAAVGARPEFYPIGDDLQILPDTRLPRARAVLAVNYFGFPADLARISMALFDDETIVIEDNAHGWLSTDSAGQPLGTRTALGITSFRKTIRSPDGAYLAWNTRERPLDMEHLTTPISARTDLLPPSYLLRRLIATGEVALRLPLRYFARSVVRPLRQIARGSRIPEHVEDEFVLPTTRAIHAISLSMANDCDAEREIRRRRTTYATCQELALQCDLQPLFDELPAYVCPQGFAYLESGDRTRSFDQLVSRRRLGEPMSWPTLPSRSPLERDSKLRNLRLINFLS